MSRVTTEEPCVMRLLKEYLKDSWKTIQNDISYHPFDSQLSNKRENDAIYPR